MKHCKGWNFERDLFFLLSRFLRPFLAIGSTCAFSLGGSAHEIENAEYFRNDSKISSVIAKIADFHLVLTSHLRAPP